MLSRNLRSLSVVSRAGRIAGNFSAKSLVVSHFPKSAPSCHLLLSHAFSTEKATKADDAEPAQASEKKDNAVAKFDYDEYDDYEEPKTAGQKVCKLMSTIFTQQHTHPQCQTFFSFFCCIPGEILLRGGDAAGLSGAGRSVCGVHGKGTVPWSHEPPKLIF